MFFFFIFEQKEMRKLLLYLCLLNSLTLFSQQKETSIIVNYTSVITLDDDFEFDVPKGVILSKDDERVMRNNIAQPNFYKLTITKGKSLYEYVETINNNQDENSIAIRVKGPGSELAIYRDIQTTFYIAQHEFFGQNFIVTDSLKKQNWKLVDEEKEILDYKVKKAILKDNGNIMTAWYAIDLPYKTGPEYYGDLPGVILEIIFHYKSDTMSGTNTITANNVTTLRKSIEIKKPKHGKKIKNKSELESIIKQQLNEFKQMQKDAIDTSID